MEQRIATHAEAVFIARALNLRIETVWEIIRGLPFATYADLETAVHNSFLQRVPVPQTPTHTTGQ
jgi:hypothetical protein